MRKKAKIRSLYKYSQPGILEPAENLGCVGKVAYFMGYHASTFRRVVGSRLFLIILVFLILYGIIHWGGYTVEVIKEGKTLFLIK